jgi:hypothetical protein
MDQEEQPCLEPTVVDPVRLRIIINKRLRIGRQKKKLNSSILAAMCRVNQIRLEGRGTPVARMSSCVKFGKSSTSPSPINAPSASAGTTAMVERLRNVNRFSHLAYEQSTISREIGEAVRYHSSSFRFGVRHCHDLTRAFVS